MVYRVEIGDITAQNLQKYAGDNGASPEGERARSIIEKQFEVAQ